MYFYAMKSFLLLVFTCLFAYSTINDLIDSVWTFKVANGCVNKLIFKANGKATSYDCELNYTLQCTYIIKRDTLLVTEKDDSHSEDGVKAHFYRTKYILENKDLYVIGKGELIKDKWKDVKLPKAKSGWERVQ